MKGDSVIFEHGGDYQGQELTIVYAAKLETAKKLKGTINVKPFDAAGTFTAEPVAAGATAAPSEVTSGAPTLRSPAGMDAFRQPSTD